MNIRQATVMLKNNQFNFKILIKNVSIFSVMIY
jgi:hypothetical protein